jgi:hypothetical protein
MVNTLTAMHNVKCKQIDFTKTKTKPIWTSTSITKLSAIYARLGVKQSKSDPCLFLGKDMIIVIYMDDCLIYARDTKEIKSFVKTLRDDYKLTINDTDPIDDFLGIYFCHQDNGELYTSQTGLVDAVTESAHIPKR